MVTTDSIDGTATPPAALISSATWAATELSAPVTKTDEAQANLGLRTGRIRGSGRTKPHRGSRNTGGMNEKLPAREI